MQPAFETGLRIFSLWNQYLFVVERERTTARRRLLLRGVAILFREQRILQKSSRREKSKNKLTKYLFLFSSLVS